MEFGHAHLHAQYVRPSNNETTGGSMWSGVHVAGWMKQVRRANEVESLVVRLTGASDMGPIKLSASQCAIPHGDLSCVMHADGTPCFLTCTVR